MAATLQSVTGKGMKKPAQEINVNSKDDIINKKINERMKRKQKLHELMNKIKDPDIA